MSLVNTRPFKTALWAKSWVTALGQKLKPMIPRKQSLKRLLSGAHGRKSLSLMAQPILKFVHSTQAM